MSIAVMKQALEALEDPWKSGPDGVASAITAIRAAIEQPRQWVELTDDEARALVNRATFGERTNWQALVYMVDAKLKEKNAA
jgi:hypothetical protein